MQQKRVFGHALELLEAGFDKALVLSQESFLNKNADWSLPLDGKTNHSI